MHSAYLPVAKSCFVSVSSAAPTGERTAEITNTKNATAAIKINRPRDKFGSDMQRFL
jgi:hypothetical protein